MKRISLLTSFIAIALLASPILAGQGLARIDLRLNKGELKITPSKVPNIRVTHAGWAKTEQEKKRFVTSSLLVSDEKWTQVILEVTPSVDGTIDIHLRGQWDKNFKNWTYFDDISAEGMTIVNRSFEKKGGWHYPKTLAITDESLAHTGKNAVRVWHDQFARQTVAVKADVPIKITAWVKFDTTEKKASKPAK